MKVIQIATVDIGGYIVPDDHAEIYREFGYRVCCPADVRAAIENTSDEEIHVRINSGGGDVFSGFEIYTLLRRCGKKSIAEVESIAASAASTVMIGCNVVQLSPVAQVMIHNPTTGTEGDAAAHRSSAGALESIKEAIINGYELRVRGKCTRTQISHMMDNETWLSAQEAIDKGFADEIMQFPAEQPQAAQFVNAFCGLPPIERLKKELAEKTENTAAHDVAAKKIEIEKIRYGGIYDKT